MLPAKDHDMIKAAPRSWKYVPAFRRYQITGNLNGGSEGTLHRIVSNRMPFNTVRLCGLGASHSHLHDYGHDRAADGEPAPLAAHRPPAEATAEFRHWLR